MERAGREGAGRERGSGEGGRKGVIDYFKSENRVTGILVFFKGKRMTSIPLSYFKAQKFTIDCNSHLLFFPCTNINLRCIKVVLCIRS